jgi:hypothetical protein
LDEPSWLLLVGIGVLLIPMVVSAHRGDHRVTRVLTFVANGLITVAMIASLIGGRQGGWEKAC